MASETASGEAGEEEGGTRVSLEAGIQTKFFPLQAQRYATASYLPKSTLKIKDNSLSGYLYLVVCKERVQGWIGRPALEWSGRRA